MPTTKATRGSAGARWRTLQGLVVKFLREAAGLSQQQFGDAVGLTSQGVSNVETGRANVPEDRVALFATTLKVDLRQFAAFIAYTHCPDLGAILWPAVTRHLERFNGSSLKGAAALASMFRASGDRGGR